MYGPYLGALLKMELQVPSVTGWLKLSTKRKLERARRPELFPHWWGPSSVRDSLVRCPLRWLGVAKACDSLQCRERRSIGIDM